MSPEVTRIIETVGGVVDVAGVAVIAGGILVITLITLPALVRRSPNDEYHTYRRRIGKSILLGLELIVAADIIRTVALEPTLEGVVVLGGLILVRTFLSFSLEIELYGRLPWKRGPEKAAEG